MPATLSLSQYVKRMNGVPLGARRSMRNMLSRALGASSFALFWHYWNPIWGYYLSRFVMKPLSKVVPQWLAVLLTFLLSGALHDVAISLVKWQVFLFFTPWFGLMAGVVIVTKKYALTYAGLAWALRALLNLSIIVVSFSLIHLSNIVVQRMS